MKRTGPTNENLQSLISELRKKAIETEAPILKRLAMSWKGPQDQEELSSEQG